MNNEPNIFIHFSWSTFSCHGRIRLCLQRVILAGKHDQKTRSTDFSRQSVVKYSKVCCMRYTQHTN